MHIARLVGAAAMVVALACGPTTNQPVQVMALVRTGGGAEGPGGRYAPTQVTLRTLSDAFAMKGSVTNLVGGAKIIVDPNDPLLRINGGALTDDQIAEVFVKNAGAEPRGSYIEKDGVLWPADFHTWNMVTVYLNLETSFDYFQAVGVPGETLQGLTTYYFPEFVLTELGPNPQLDNALYFAPVKSLMVLPFEARQEAPFAMNSWIVGHEYAHVVWNRLVYGGAGFPAPFTKWGGGFGSTPQINTLKALDEGLADFHAFGVSCRTAFGCDPRGNESSFDAAFADARDISKRDKCMTADLQTALISNNVNGFSAGGNDYKLGSIIASSLYHAGKSPQDWEVLQKSLVAAYPKLRAHIEGNLETPDNFTLHSVANLLLESVDSVELRTRLCGEFLGRLKLSRDQLTDCPPLATESRDCP